MVKFLTTVAILACLAACDSGSGQRGSTQGPSAAAAQPTPAKSNTPPLDPTNIVSIALGSPDHTTLVAALKAADYVTGVSNPGPLTVFAPTNAAFAALPAGTVENLIKPENVAQLRHILQHHVVPSVYTAAGLRDGQELGMVDGTRVTVRVSDGQVTIDGAKIVASIKASNGIVHVIDKVLLPPAKN
jgi:uncharacterized surface protein with fasciclin (FAS1) repeats